MHAEGAPKWQSCLQILLKMAAQVPEYEEPGKASLLVRFATRKVQAVSTRHRHASSSTMRSLATQRDGE
jgi:hypothetical protein